MVNSQYSRNIPEYTRDVGILGVVLGFSPSVQPAYLLPCACSPAEKPGFRLGLRFSLACHLVAGLGNALLFPGHLCGRTGDPSHPATVSNQHWKHPHPPGPGPVHWALDSWALSRSLFLSPVWPLTCKSVFHFSSYSPWSPEPRVVLSVPGCSVPRLGSWISLPSHLVGTWPVTAPLGPHRCLYSPLPVSS